MMQALPSSIIVLTARVPPDPSTIGDYACLLAAALRAMGYTVEIWSLRSATIDAACGPARSFAAQRTDLRRGARVVRAARRMPGAVVLWQHNPFMYGWKGLPLATGVLPLSLALFGRCRVVAILHEIAVDPLHEVSVDSPYDVRNWIWTAWHRLVLWLTMLGCTAGVATSAKRAAFLRRFINRYLPWRAHHMRVATIPAGSMIPAPPRMLLRQRDAAPVRIGAFFAGLPRPRGAFVRDLYDRLRGRGHAIQIVLLGCEAGEMAPAPLDERPGIRGIRYLPAERVAEVMAELDIFLVLPDDGASGRRTALAAAFAFGLCVVSTTGVGVDEHLFRHGENCLLVAPSKRDQLVAALERCIADAALRARLGRAAFDTFQESMSWPAIARGVVEIIGS